MEDEIRRRLKILEKHDVPQITQMDLQGDMQSRLHRQETMRYGLDIKEKKTKLKNKLSLIEKEKQNEGFGGFSAQSSEVLDDFDEPVFRRIRSRRGFFNE